jgi:predicted RNA-binding Zn ribbon-like protein
MQDTQTHAPPKTDHVHSAVPVETAFDFLNTWELEDGAYVERLPNVKAAATWLAEHGIVGHRKWIAGAGPDEAGVSAYDRILRTRTALRDVAHAVAHDEAPPGDAIAEVNRALGARVRIELVPSPDGVKLGHSHVGDAVDDALARIADPIVRALGSGQEDRIRVCANDTCQWLFFDESRTGRRRWCDMATCGNRAKAQRHRARKKEAPGAEARAGAAAVDAPEPAA